jgi:hypothetical protein
VFPGGPKGKVLADLAIAQGSLFSKEEKVKKGKASKKVVYGILTEKGLRRVMDADSPKAALEALVPAVQALGKQPPPPNPDAFRTELAKATQTCVGAIQEAFTKLQSAVLTALAPPSGPPLDPGMVLNSLRRALERVEAAPNPRLPPTPLANAADSGLEEAIVAFVQNWASVKSVGCQFDVVWKHLKDQQPNLTVGGFQDALRKLSDAGRIRLGGWPRMLDDLPQPELALFVSSKVMYYAHPAQANG